MTQAPEPSAPPLFEADIIPGYEEATGNSEKKDFPSPPDTVPGGEGKPWDALEDWNAIAISEEVAKRAFEKYVATKCCYSEVPAREMEIREAQSFNTYRYCLETFVESRSSKWKTEPYRGDPVDSSPDGMAPYPWAVRVDASAMFKNETRKVIVPHTSSVMTCPSCHGQGKVSCSSCHGCGTQSCFSCSGNGECSSCSGTGTVTCTFCSGWGETTCSRCTGRGKLLTYLQLKVTWENKLFEYVMDHGFGFPIKVFKSVKGQQLLLDEQPMVSPVVGFPAGIINEVSRNALNKHQAMFASTTPISGPDPSTATWSVIEQPSAEFPSTSWILRQRQTIELLYLTRVEYEWQGKFYSYYVYGNEHKVFTEDYPQKCCCTLM
ncbi:protein SSUH2 homolog isoform X2 [Varanus komodoensis]|uniref:protein SSUH2 homolog isoform X2 n=1 Tax=Varanus komodoensis TaxID=61221 RepID=UPI001CF7C95E|nr:protein SSUH2 homolog isoform X2 [Varanus komodoensis]